MALILSIETTTTNCSVALAKDGTLIGLKEHSDKKYSHSEKLHGFMKEVLEEAGHNFSDLEAIAVSKGPGSYTGLRIGVSAAKGLCFAQDLPLISTDTLRAVALQVDPKNYDFIIPMLDARRMEVYTAVFDKGFNTLKPTEALVLEEDSFEKYLKNGKVCFIGNGALKFKNLCSSDKAVFEESLPSSKEMIAMAEGKFQNKDFENLAYFEPYYLKDFKV